MPQEKGGKPIFLAAKFEPGCCGSCEELRVQCIPLYGYPNNEIPIVFPGRCKLRCNLNKNIKICRLTSKSVDCPKIRMIHDSFDITSP
jgi:hypothetical protein